MTFTCSGCGQFIKGNRVESFESLCNVCWKKSEKCVAVFLDSIESRRIGGGGGGWPQPLQAKVILVIIMML